MVSADGRMDRLDVDLEHYYSLISAWEEDLTLTGSETMLQPGWGALEHDGTTVPSQAAPISGGQPGKVQVLGQDGSLSLLAGRSCPVLELHSQEHIDHLRRSGIDTIITLGDKVDLKKALERSAGEQGVRVVRADSGRTLNEALLRSGPIDEVSVLI